MFKTFSSTVNTFWEFHFKQKKRFKVSLSEQTGKKSVLSLNEVYGTPINVGNK